MKRTESRCVECGLPCVAKFCPYREIPVYYCDECEDETELYEFDGRELCINCIKKLLKKVRADEE